MCWSCPGELEVWGILQRTEPYRVGLLMDGTNLGGNFETHLNEITSPQN